MSAVNGLTAPLAMPESGSVRGNADIGDLQDLVLTACLARNEILDQRTSDKVRDIQEKIKKIGEARAALLELKNHKPDGTMVWDYSEATRRYLASHPEVLPQGAVAVESKLKRYYELKAKEELSDDEKLEWIENIAEWSFYEGLKNHFDGALCVVLERSDDFDDLTGKIELAIKRETADAHAKAVGLQGSIRAGEQMLMLASDVIKKDEITHHKIIDKQSER